MLRLTRAPGGGCPPDPMRPAAGSSSLGPAKSNFLAKLRRSEESVRFRARTCPGRSVWAPRRAQPWTVNASGAWPRYVLARLTLLRRSVGMATALPVRGPKGTLRPWTTSPTSSTRSACGTGSSPRTATCSGDRPHKRTPTALAVRRLAGRCLRLLSRGRRRTDRTTRPLPPPALRPRRGTSRYNARAGRGCDSRAFQSTMPSTRLRGAGQLRRTSTAKILPASTRLV